MTDEETTVDVTTPVVDAPEEETTPAEEAPEAPAPEAEHTA